MTDQIQDSLFQNTAYTRAFFAQMKQPSKSVSWNGNCWSVGDQNFQMTDAKMNSVKVFFCSLAHKVNIKCSLAYRKKFIRVKEQFDYAHVVFGEKENAKALMFHQAMVTHSTAKRNFQIASKEILEREKTAGDLNIKWNEAEAVIKNGPQIKPEEDPIVSGLKRKVEALLDLEIFIPEYVKSRVPKEGMDAVAGWFEDRFSKEESEEQKELKAFAEATLGHIPLDEQNPFDNSQFLNFVSEEMKKLSDEQGKRILALNTPKDNLEKIENEIKQVQEEIKDWKTKRIEAAKVMRKVYDDCARMDPRGDDMSLHPPRFPEIDEVMRDRNLKAAEPPFQSGSVAIAEQQLIEETQTMKFLNALEQATTKDMKNLWEALFDNIKSKSGQDIVASFKKVGNSFNVQLKEKMSIYMLSMNPQGEEDPRQEPEGGSVFTLGDNLGRMTFTPMSRNELSLTGFYTCARLPNSIANTLPSFVIQRIGEYVSADLPTVRVKGDQVTIIAYKKVGLISRRPERTNFLSPYINHWKNHGKVINRNTAKSSKLTPEEAFLRKERAKLIKDKKI